MEVSDKTSTGKNPEYIYFLRQQIESWAKLICIEHRAQMTDKLPYSSSLADNCL